MLEFRLEVQAAELNPGKSRLSRKREVSKAIMMC